MRNLVIFGLLLLFTSIVHGQDSNWNAVYFNPTQTGGELVVINQDGFSEAIQFPETMLEPAQEGSLTVEVSVSPDLRYLVVGYQRTSNESSAARLIVYDLVNSSQAEVEAPQGFAQIIRGFAFNPEGTRLAVIYLVTETESSTQGVAGVMTVNPVNGQIDAQITVPEVNELIEADFEDIWLYTGSWMADGIEIIPACLNCDGIDPAPFWLWNPDTNRITEAQSYYINRGSRLPVTGEVLMPELDDEYPTRDDSDAYLPPSNVIKYYPAGTEPDGTGTVVYFEEKNLPLGSAIWGMDGQAFFTRQQGEAEGIFVLRDGTIITGAIPKGPLLVTANPDGWLLIDQTGQIYDFRIVNGEVTYTEVFKLAFDQNYGLAQLGAGGIIYGPDIGAAADASQIFPEIPAP